MAGATLPPQFVSEGFPEEILHWRHQAARYAPKVEIVRGLVSRLVGVKTEEGNLPLDVQSYTGQGIGEVADQ